MRLADHLEKFYLVYLAWIPVVGIYLLFTTTEHAPNLGLAIPLGIAAMAIYLAVTILYTSHTTSVSKNILRIIDGPIWMSIAAYAGKPWTYLVIETMFLEMSIVLTGQLLAAIVILRGIEKREGDKAPSRFTLLTILLPLLFIVGAALVYLQTESGGVLTLPSAFLLGAFIQGVVSLLSGRRLIEEKQERELDDYLLFFVGTIMAWVIVAYLGVVLR